ncbi:MAG: hypothetical protein GX418_00220 [Clostridiales bacterium]|nr:hypothetical protein [Clostridiales bacterium]
MKNALALLVCTILLVAALPAPVGAESPLDLMPPLTAVEQMVDADGHVIFTDAVVEHAIRESLGMPEGPITPKQLASVGKNGEQLNIVATTATPADLSVLQFCTKLKGLYLERVIPISLAAITAIKSLTYFGAKQIQFTDLGFLAGIKGLSDVWISECPCKDISAVTEMPKLINFSIDFRVHDLSPLYTCKKLIALAVAYQSDTEVNVLLDHLSHKLTYLGLNTCAITDATLERIAGTKLNGIMLDNVPVRSVAPLWRMKALQDVRIYSMPINTLDGIQDMKKLRSLHLIGTTGKPDYSPIFAQPSIRSLRFVSVDAPDLQGIQDAGTLEELSLEGIDGTVDLTPVFGIPKLKRLLLNTVTVTTLAGIEGMLKLTDLELYSVHGIVDYSPLLGLVKIRHIGTDTPERIPEGLPVQ